MEKSSNSTDSWMIEIPSFSQLCMVIVCQMLSELNQPGFFHICLAMWILSLKTKLIWISSYSSSLPFIYWMYHLDNDMRIICILLLFITPIYDFETLFYGIVFFFFFNNFLWYCHCREFPAVRMAVQPVLSCCPYLFQITRIFFFFFLFWVRWKSNSGRSLPVKKNKKKTSLNFLEHYCTSILGSLLL